MPSNIFKRNDIRYLASALSTDTTHEGIDTFETPLGLNTEGNKSTRSMQVMQYIFSEPDTDSLIISLLNYLYVENPYADTSQSNETFRQLNENVFRARGITLTDNGYALPDGRDIDQIERIDRKPLLSPPKPTFDEALSALSRHPGGGEEDQTDVARDPNKVFVVHGRDMRPVSILGQYLMFLGLQMMPWSEAVQLTGKSQPHTYDVVLTGMTHAAAIVVIFSPDDLARAKDDFSSADDPDRHPQGQARQNVLLEAGMAFAMAPDRTIFLKSSLTRDISDIAGFNWVNLDGAWDSRRDLKNRLETAGAQVRPGNDNLGDSLAGPFRVT